METVITLEGINQAISALGYRNKRSLKYRLVDVIRARHNDEGSSETFRPIRTEDLIRRLWDTGDNPEEIKRRRRNFTSVKSSVNAELKRLYENGKNPEGIVIGPDNRFILSEEAKERALQSLIEGGHGTTPLNLEQISEVLKIINEMLSRDRAQREETPSGDLDKNLDQLKGLIQGLAENLGLEDTDPAAADDHDDLFEAVPDVEKGAVIEELEEDEDAEIVEEAVDDELYQEEVAEEGTDDYEETEAMVQVDLDDMAVVEDDEAISGGEESGTLGGMDDNADGSADEEVEKARVLSEEFNSSLAAMDRYYNQYVYIPGGEYVVGSNRKTESGGSQKSVRLPCFYLGQFPVTNALFEVFVEKTGYETTAEKIGYGNVYFGRYQKAVNKETGLMEFQWRSALVCERVSGACWYQPAGPGSNLHHKRNHPVVQVSLEDAMAFAAWTGKRLPSEEEWEAAARTVKGWRYPWGEAWADGCCNVEGSYVGETTPVDQYGDAGNQASIQDTLGNVMEWTLNQVVGRVRGQEGPETYVAKGGSWISGTDISLSSRFKLDPDACSNILGFRCVAY